MIKKNLVAGQNSANTFKMTRGESGCCGDAATDCQYTATYTQANTTTLLTITEGGVDVALPLVLGANSTPAQVETAIRAALEAADFYDDENEIRGIVVTDLGSTLQIVITGDVVVKSLTASGGTSTFDADCTVTGLCTFAYTGFTAGAGSVLKINGEDQSIGDITAGTTSAATVKTSVESALTAAGITGTTVTVTTTGSGGTQTYNVTIALAPAQSTFVLVGADAVARYLVRSACAQYYV